MEIAMVCRHGANKKKFVEVTVGAGKFGTENDLRSQLLTGAVLDVMGRYRTSWKYIDGLGFAHGTCALFFGFRLGSRVGAVGRAAP